MKKLSLIILSALLIITVGTVYLKLNKQNSSGKEANRDVEEIKKEISLILDFGDGNTLTYTSPTEEGSVFELLQEVAGKEGFALETQQYDFGIFVKSIDGKESSAERAWIYFVNGESADVAADQYLVKSGDVIEWKYVEPN